MQQAHLTQTNYGNFNPLIYIVHETRHHNSKKNENNFLHRFHKLKTHNQTHKETQPETNFQQESKLSEMSMSTKKLGQGQLSRKEQWLKPMDFTKLQVHFSLERARLILLSHQQPNPSVPSPSYPILWQKTPPALSTQIPNMIS